MKFKKWLEVSLIIITIILSVRIFMVEESTGCIYLLVILFNIVMIDTYGTIGDKLNAILDEFILK